MKPTGERVIHPRVSNKYVVFIGHHRTQWSFDCWPIKWQKIKSGRRIAGLHLLTKEFRTSSFIIFINSLWRLAPESSDQSSISNATQVSLFVSARSSDS